MDLSNVAWRKSSRSNSDQECVEVARGVAWRESDQSNNGGNSVKVAALTAKIGVRDSKNPEGGHLAMDRATFAELLTRVRAGAFDPDRPQAIRTGVW